MTTGLMAPEQNLEKPMPGCMAGFLHIFHRHHLLTGKRLPSTKLLPPSVVDSESDSDNPLASPPVSLESGELNVTSPELSHPPVELRPPALTPVKTQTHRSHPLHASSEFKESIRSSWKFSKDAPRLSLDSRAIVDAKGSIHPREIRTNASILSVNSNGTGDDGDKQHRSPSVIARLMGLEPLSNPDSEPVKKAELRRSASESRVSKDFYQYRFVDANNFQRKQSNLQGDTANNVVAENVANVDYISKGREADRPEFGASIIKVQAAKASHNMMGQRNSFFDSADVLYEQKQTASMYGEIGKRLRMRPSDDSSKDLDSLRQILKALQLKGLLRSDRPSNQTSPRNMVPDRHLYQSKSAIVVMKPVKPGSSSVVSRAGARWSSNIVGETFPSASARRDRTAQNQLGGRKSLGEKNLNRRGGALKIEMQRAKNDPAEESQRRSSPVQSRKSSPRRIGVDPQISNRTAKNKKSTPTIFRREANISSACQPISKDESSTSVSESSDAERCSNHKGADNGGGNNLLDRCDRLLSSIAEINAAELLPSPISVLDSSFYQDESSPSPVLKRQVHSKDHHAAMEDDAWSGEVSSGKLREEDCDLAYISDILRASTSSFFPHDSNNVFLLLEKQQYGNGKDMSKASKLERKLTFDAINEILERNRQLPPWRPTRGQPLVKQIWCEMRRAEERAKANRTRTEDLVDFICSALRADLAADGVYGWGDTAVLMSPVVLDMERLIFKDLISETISHHLALFPGSCRTNHPQSVPRRKLVF